MILKPTWLIFFQDEGLTFLIGDRLDVSLDQLNVISKVKAKLAKSVTDINPLIDVDWVCYLHERH